MEINLPTLLVLIFSTLREEICERRNSNGKNVQMTSDN